MRGQLHQKLNNENGFTLAETLVALAISIILLAITMVGILQYYKNMKLTEMDTTAKEIFIAAQNHLTQADASGELKRYREDALDTTETSVNEDALGTLIPSQPSDVPDGIAWPSTNKDFYYIKYNVNDSTVGNLEGSILQYMLPFGAIDETVRADGNYIIEYNVKTATVYGVFYAENDVNFSYIDITALDRKDGRKDTADGRHTRRDYDAGIIGYYGGAMAGNLLSGETADLRMEIENKDTLKITVIDPNYFNKTTDNKGTLQTHLTLIVKGKESGNEEKFTLDLTDSDNPSIVPTKKEVKKNLWWDVDTIELKDAASSDKKTGLQYTMTLDDITRPGGHFADIFPTLMPGEDVVVKVVSASTTALATVREAEGMTNSLFESVKKDADAAKENKKQAIASIGYLRHLENLDPGVSKLPQNTNAVKDGTKILYKPEYLVKRAEQTRDMDWNEFFGKNVENRKSVYKFGLKEDAVNAEKLADGSFYGIKNDLLYEYDGYQHRISNVYIDNKNQDSHQDSSGEGKVDGALIRYCQTNFAISNLVLENFDVTAERNAAALVAEMQNPKSGNVTGLRISNVLVVGGSITSNFTRGNAGGLIGYTGTRTVVSDCAANAKITAKGARLDADYAGDAGGLIGEMKSDGREIRISNSYSGGQTEKGKYKSTVKTDYNIYGVDSAGGLIGKINGSSNTKIVNSYSTCSVYVADDKSEKITGSAGGLVGKQRIGSASYENCYATGLVNGDTGAYVGAFIGYSQSADTFKDCYFLKGINKDDLVSASTHANVRAIKAYSYIEMPKNNAAITTHPMDSYLTDKSYPFKTVNKTGLKLTDDTSSEGVHYGDWQEPAEEEASSARAFAYREEIEGKDFWYIVSADENDEGKTIINRKDALTRDKEVNVNDTAYSYGILIPAEEDDGKLEGLFKNGDPMKYLESKPETVEIKLNDKETTTYHYYQIKMNEIDTLRDEDTGIVKFLTWKTKGSKGDDVTFYFNPDFAGAISANSETALGHTVPYQVRTNMQLRNVASNSYQETYRNCNYKQTVDIKLMKDKNGDTNFKPFGGEAFLGTYNAFYKDGKGYDIDDFKQNITSAGKTGLITRIGSGASVSYVNLHGKITTDNITTDKIGSLTGQLSGEVQNCFSDVTMNLVNSVSYSGDIGGLIGDVAVGAKVSNCHYTSVNDNIGLRVNLSGTPGTINVGGLVGDNSGEISNSSANAKITYQVNNPQNCFIGGLIGLIDQSGKVENSWTKTSFVGTGSFHTYFGGFVGKISGESTIVNSYAVLSNGNTFNVGFATLYTFAGLHEKVTNVSGTVKNCHAVELAYDNSLLLNANPFVNGESLKDNANCYMYRSGTGEPGVTYVLNIDDYKRLSTFKGFDNTIWEIKKGFPYPSLKLNPES